jgi:hypothetical protein
MQALVNEGPTLIHCVEGGQVDGPLPVSVNPWFVALANPPCVAPVNFVLVASALSPK